MFSRFVHAAVCHCLIPIYGRITFHCTDRPHRVRPLVSRWACTQVFVRVEVSVSLVRVPKCSRRRPWGVCALFVRCCPGASATQPRCRRSHRQCARDPVSQHPRRHFGLVLFFAAILIGLRISLICPQSRNLMPGAMCGESQPCPLPASIPFVSWPALGPPICLVWFARAPPPYASGPHTKTLKAPFKLWSHIGGQEVTTSGTWTPRGSAGLHRTANVSPGVHLEPQIFSVDKTLGKMPASGPWDVPFVEG